jgi:hypothetical protein
MALEALLVDFGYIFNRLDEINDDEGILKITVLTQRAFNPELLKLNVPVILDYVDLLSISYNQRSVIDRSHIKKFAYKVLAKQSKRFESYNEDNISYSTNPTEAEKVSGRYFPILIKEDLINSKNISGFKWEIIFMGSLDYPPNICAIRAISETIIPGIRKSLGEVSVCIAGRRPTKEVKSIIRLIDAELVEDFIKPQDVLCFSKLATSPVYLASGFQNKILEAAVLKVPQIISDSSSAPFKEIDGIVIAKSDNEFIDKTVEFLGNFSTYKQRAINISAQVTELFSPKKYLQILDEY